MNTQFHVCLVLLVQCSMRQSSRPKTQMYRQVGWLWGLFLLSSASAQKCVMGETQRGVSLGPGCPAIDTFDVPLSTCVNYSQTFGDSLGAVTPEILTTYWRTVMFNNTYPLSALTNHQTCSDYRIQEGQTICEIFGATVKAGGPSCTWLCA